MPIVIVGGPTATGKTSIAKKLNEIFNWNYVEADEYHSQANVDKMHAGIALTDEDRLPWLQRLHQELEKYLSTNRSCVMTCSALKKTYRQILLSGAAEPDAKAKEPTEGFYMILLTAPREVLHDRLVKRQHEHFMNPGLLDSQLKTLELPKSRIDEPHTYVVNCEGLSPDEVVDQIRKIINK